MSDPRNVIAEAPELEERNVSRARPKWTREQAVAHGCPPCLDCEEGWLQYLICPDIHSCWKCGSERLS